MTKLRYKLALVLLAGMAHLPQSALAQTSVNAELASGEVRRIDKEAQKITLRHGEIKSLAMPPMTMVFKVEDRALLDKVQVGDPVKFDAVQRDGSLVLTILEPR